LAVCGCAADPLAADTLVGLGSCEGVAVLVGSDGNACRPADGRGETTSGPCAGTAAASAASERGRVGLDGCFSRFADRWSCRGAGERCGIGEGMAIGCGCWLVGAATGLGALNASIVGTAVTAGDPSAAGDDTPASMGLGALEGADADALGATAVAEGLAAAVGVSEATGVMEIEGCGTAVSSAKRSRLMWCT
jgi:hypothetical protein